MNRELGRYVKVTLDYWDLISSFEVGNFQASSTCLYKNEIEINQKLWRQNAFTKLKQNLLEKFAPILGLFSKWQ